MLDKQQIQCDIQLGFFFTLLLSLFFFSPFQILYTADDDNIFLIHLLEQLVAYGQIALDIVKAVAADNLRLA